MGRLINAAVEYWTRKDNSESREVIEESTVLAYLNNLANKYLVEGKQVSFDVEVSESRLNKFRMALNNKVFQSAYTFEEVEFYPNGAVRYRIRQQELGI